MGVRNVAPPFPAFLLVLLLVLPVVGEAQETDRIWGRVHSTSGDVHEGFIRWDRNEGSWVDLLDGSKDSPEFEYLDWWRLAHPDSGIRDRVIEMAGYRITWDDDEPDFSESHESGIRFGHIATLTPTGDDGAQLVLRSGRLVELKGGSTDLGTGLRKIVVTDRQGETSEVVWEELEKVEFMEAPSDVVSGVRRLHGTVQSTVGSSFTGYISWNSDKIFTSDPVMGLGSRRRSGEALFGEVASVRRSDGGFRVRFADGSESELLSPPDAGRVNTGIEIFDSGLGFVGLDWEEVESVRFHPPERSVSLRAFDGGRRLYGTVMTADSTELTGWVLWDADEAFSWELLDGYSEGLKYEVELGRISSIERLLNLSATIEVGPTGVDVHTDRVEGALVTLRDGRSFQLAGSNDVDDSNDGVFVLEEGKGYLPDDSGAVWTMVRWEDFRAVRFRWEDWP